MSCHAKKQKSLSGESPGKFNQWIRRPRLGSPAYVGAARNMSSERGKSCERSSLVLFCLLFFGYCFFFCLSSADCRRREDWKVEFPDDSSFPCPSPYRGCGGWPFGNRIHRLMRSFHPSIINIAKGSISRPLERKKFWKFISVFLSASLEMTESWWCYLHIKVKFLRKVVKKGCLCNINVWRRKSGNSMEGFYFPSVMYIANIPAGMQLWQKGRHESLYRLLIFLPDFPGKIGTNSADS